MSESSTCFQFTIACQKMKDLGILVTGGFLFLIYQSLEVPFGMPPAVLNKADFWGGVAWRRKRRATFMFLFLFIYVRGARAHTHTHSSHLLLYSSNACTAGARLQLKPGSQELRRPCAWRKHSCLIFHYCFQSGLSTRSWSTGHWSDCSDGRSRQLTG